MKHSDNIIALGNKFENKLAKTKKPVYYGIFLDDENHSILLNWWVSSISDSLLDNKFAHHMTVKFSPSDEDVTNLEPLIGKRVQLKVIGYASDDKGQAVLISSDIKSNNANPHITISCAAGVKPVYSNELLAKNLVHIDGPVLTGMFDSFPRTF